MSESGESQVYRLESGRPADQLRYRNAAGNRRRLLVIARYQGPELPKALTNPVVDAVGERDQASRNWRIRCAEGRFEFRALAVEQLEEFPALYEPLHQPFRLSASDRLAVLALLWLLRIPGGTALLRRWHAHRH
ncbi:MAG: hypothetical protein EXR87_04005 [Gammaproteobacteria bacterium]|nr:hypothetical protein [Gammaproteobacteria bacterium]